jgi:hypothetical protein
MPTRTGFGLKHLLIVLGALFMLFVYVTALVLLPGRNGARALAKRAVCGTRVKGLANAFEMYKAEGDDTYPCLGETTVLGGPARGAAREREFFSDGNRKDSNIQHYWLLVLRGLVGDQQFQCPSDDSYQMPDRNALKYGFTSWRNVSYGFQPATVHPANSAYPCDSMDGGTIIVGDKPGPNKREWNANHHGEGGNFLSMNMSVRFYKQKDNRFGYPWDPKRGIAGNNVFLIDMNKDGKIVKGTTKGLPPYINDSYLHWTDDEK